MGASLRCPNGRGDARLDLCRGVGHQYGLGLSGARLAVVLRADVSPYGRWGAVRAWASSCGSVGGRAHRRADGAAHPLGVTPLGALAGTRGGAGGGAPGDTWGHDGLVAVTPSGVGSACLSGTGVSVSRHHLSGLYRPWLAGAPAGRA